MSKNYFGFTSDRADTFLLLIDESSSMSSDEENMRTGLKLFRKSFDDFPEINSISVSKCTFSSDFYPDAFKSLSDFDTSYSTSGRTALYYSIVKGAEMLLKYVEQITDTKNLTPKATFIVFSDGEPCHDKATRSSAMRAIKVLNDAGITTVFVAFGSAISSEFGEEMGFISTKDVNNREDLTEFMGEELSTSVKKQSASVSGLGANFFSKANVQSSSNDFSSKTSQVLEDDSWIDEI